MKELNPLMIRPMSPPVDTIYYIELLYNGKTSQQLFKEDIANGVYRKPYLETRLEFERERDLCFVLDGPPQPERPIIRVNLYLSEVYVPVSKNKGIETHHSRIIKSWTWEEWNEVI